METKCLEIEELDKGVGLRWGGEVSVFTQA